MYCLVDVVRGAAIVVLYLSDVRCVLKTSRGPATVRIGGRVCNLGRSGQVSRFWPGVVDTMYIVHKLEC